MVDFFLDSDRVTPRLAAECTLKMTRKTHTLAVGVVVVAVVAAVERTMIASADELHCSKIDFDSEKDWQKMQKSETMMSRLAKYR